MSHAPEPPPPVLVAVDGPVAVVTLNRPSQRNALDPTLLAGLRAAMAGLDADPAVAAVVLTGADPAFCAGLDLKAIESGALDLVEDLAASSAGGVRVPPSPLPPMTTPVIGAVNGVAVTGGLELALACDYLVASDRARFADTHGRVGVQPAWGLTVNLAEAVGVRRAREMSSTGNYIDAATALQWGLVNHVVGHAELVEFAVGLARDVASNDGPAVARLLASYADAAERHRTEALLHEVEVAARWVRQHPPAPGEIARRRTEIVDRARRRSSEPTD